MPPPFKKKRTISKVGVREHLAVNCADVMSVGGGGGVTPLLTSQYIV